MPSVAVVNELSACSLALQQSKLLGAQLPPPEDSPPEHKHTTCNGTGTHSHKSIFPLGPKQHKPVQEDRSNADYLRVCLNSVQPCTPLLRPLRRGYSSHRSPSLIRPSGGTCSPTLHLMGEMLSERTITRSLKIPDWSLRLAGPGEDGGPHTSFSEVCSSRLHT